MDTYVSHLECSITGEKYNKNEIHNLSKVGKPLLVVYNLDEIKKKYLKRNFIKKIIMVFGNTVFFFQ